MEVTIKVFIFAASRHVGQVRGPDAIDDVERKITDMEGNNLNCILSEFLLAIAEEQRVEDRTPLLSSLVGIYKSICNSEPVPSFVHEFLLDDESAANIIKKLKCTLQEMNVMNIERLNSPITYLLDELICNIQQHAHTDKGYTYIGYNSLTNSIELVIADAGITIYGSYVSAQKYLELIGNSDAAALNLAQNGYSTKNLPEAENRGYGISSNIKMVTEGLGGELAVLSGNALLVYLAGQKNILVLPKKVDFTGTMIIVRFPATIPNEFNLYNYTN